jgi:hypothetical protein
MIQLCGFTNWPFKYTDRQGGRHEAVETEWHLAGFLSAYNVYTEADAAAPQYVSNASFYAGLLPAVAERRYVQSPPPTPEQLRSTGLLDAQNKVPDGNYIMMALGDYDQASWVMYRLGAFFDDPLRGQVDCNWCVDPNAVDRASVAMDYFYRHKTARDYFAAWDSGAGYVNPSRLHGPRKPSGYPSIVPVWQEHCRRYYRQFDYSITAWIISPGEPITSKDLSIHLPFSVDGVGTQFAADIRQGEHHLLGNMPVSERIWIDGPGAGEIINFPSGVHFTWYRTILWRPDKLRDLETGYAKIARQKYRFLDVYSYYYLLRHHLGGANTHRATWMKDTFPRIVKAGAEYDVSVTVRNDGWDTWTEGDGYRLGCAVVPGGMAASTSDYDSQAVPRCQLSDGAKIAPGQTATFAYTLTAPSSPGRFDIYCDMVQDGTAWFRERGNIEWKTSVLVAADPGTVDTDEDGVPDLAETASGSLYWHPDDRPSASAPAP